MAKKKKNAPPAARQAPSAAPVSAAPGAPARTADRLGRAVAWEAFAATAAGLDREARADRLEEQATRWLEAGDLYVGLAYLQEYQYLRGRDAAAVRLETLARGLFKTAHPDAPPFIDPRLKDLADPRFQGPRLRDWRGKFAGHRLFLIGDDRSLLNQDLSPLAGEFTLAMGNAADHFERWGFAPTFYALSDKVAAPARVADWTMLAGSVRLAPARLRPTLGDPPRAIWFHEALAKQDYLAAPHFAVDPEARIWFGGHVLYDIGLPVAFYLGFSEVVLLGLDRDRPEYVPVPQWEGVSRAGVDPDGQWPLFPFRIAKFDPQVPAAMAKARRVFELDGRRLVDATDAPGVTDWPRETLAAVLARAAAEKNAAPPPEIDGLPARRWLADYLDRHDGGANAAAGTKAKAKAAAAPAPASSGDGAASREASPMAACWEPLVLSPAPKVSLIVPLYNCRDFFGRCLASMRAQSLREIEIVVVDGGSADGSLDVARRAARGDPRVRIVHAENKGPGGNRNTGILHARGEYLSFVDHDDFIRPDMMAALYRRGRDEALEIVRGWFAWVNILDEGDNGKPPVTELHRTSPLPVLGDMVSCRRGALPWAQIYHWTLFKDDPEPFPENRFFEDILGIPIIYSRAKTYGAVAQPFYRWFHNTASMSRRGMNPKDVDDAILCLDVLRKVCEDPRYKEWLYPKFLVGVYHRMKNQETRAKNSEAWATKDFLIHRLREKGYLEPAVRAMVEREIAHPAPVPAEQIKVPPMAGPLPERPRES